jgi:hypothetical protein
MGAAKKTQYEEEVVNDCIKMYGRLAGDRGNWESHWQEIAERVWPQQSRLFVGRNQSDTTGEKRNEQVYDSTAAIALNRFSAILDSLLTPRNQTWHRLVPDNPILKRDLEVRSWFDEVNAILFKLRYAPKSNFAAQNQLNYKSLGAFGSGCVFTDKLRGIRPEKGLRYRNIHLSEIYFQENHQGMVDTALRHFPMTARQLLQEFKDKCPEEVKSCVKEQPDRKFWVIHCVRPRQDYDPNRADHKGKIYASYYISVSGKVLLEEGGYDTFPYAISRYEQVPGEVYGRSPAMDVLPAIKTLNEMKKTMLKQGHKAVDPVLLAHDDGVLDGFSLRPGALNPGGVSPDGRPLVHALPVGNLDAGKELMDDERLVINDSFLVRLFQVLVETPQMTATEVMERMKEKGILLAPTIGRQQSEYLGPLVDRELSVAIELGLVPPPPQALIEARGEYKLEYDSPLSRAQRAEEAAGLMRTVEMAINVATNAQQPEVLDHFNWDEIMPDIADIQGLPARWLRAKDDIEQIRQGRAEAQQKAQAAQAAPGAAAMTKAAAVAKEKGLVN